MNKIYKFHRFSTRLIPSKIKSLGQEKKSLTGAKKQRTSLLIIVDLLTPRSRLIKYFNDKYRLFPEPMAKFYNNTWTIVCNICKSSAEPGQRYLRKLLSNEALSKEDTSVLEIMKHRLDLIEEYPHLLLKEANKKKHTEYDYYLRVLWSRLLELIFNNVKNVRIKSGESVPIFSTTNEAQLYPDESNIIGFKIDVRIVLDIGGEEFELVSMEVAKDDYDTNVIEDSSKLLRETKNDLNKLIEILSGGGYNE